MIYLKNIFKFDVDAILTQNPAISAVGRFLITTIGGNGESIYEKDTFGEPIAIRTGRDDKLYVLEKMFNGFKVYDNDLNWISTAVKTTDFQTTTGAVVDLAVDTATEHCYILTESGYIFQYDDSNKLVKSHILQDKLVANETYKKITFSEIDNNIVYVLTNKNIYKKFKTKLPISIGSFRLHPTNLIQNEEFKFINTLNLPGRVDDIVFVGGLSYNTATPAELTIGKIFTFNESTLYQTIVYDSYKPQPYPLSAINIDGDELVTSWVVNKSLDKLIYNHLLFSENIHSKYVGIYDLETGRPRYNGVNYITDSDPNLDNYTISLDYYIVINEPLLAETINRPLNQIYKLQLNLLSMCREKYTNKYPAATQCVEVS